MGWAHRDSSSDPCSRTAPAGRDRHDADSNTSRCRYPGTCVCRCTHWHSWNSSVYRCDKKYWFLDALGHERMLPFHDGNSHVVRLVRCAPPPEIDLCHQALHGTIKEKTPVPRRVRKACRPQGSHVGGFGPPLLSIRTHPARRAAAGLLHPPVSPDPLYPDAQLCHHGGSVPQACRYPVTILGQAGPHPLPEISQAAFGDSGTG